MATSLSIDPRNVITAPRQNELVVAFNRDGFAVVNLLTAAELAALRDAVGRRLDEIKALAFPNIAFGRYPLERYHEDPALTESVHKTLMKTQWRRLTLDERTRPMVRQPVLDPIFEYFRGADGMAIKRPGADGTMETDVCNIHVVPPPPPVHYVTGYHTDGWNDGWCIGLWIPLSGYDERYSLKVAPGSHLVRHPTQKMVQQGGKLRGFSDDYIDRFQFHRPRLEPGQALVLHANLLHGRSINDGDVTRVSLEAFFYDPHLVKPDTRIYGA